MTVANRPKRCVFCGSSGLSREHLWSDWIREMLEGGAAPTEVHQQRRGEPERMWKTPPFTTVVRCVCGDCNSGWMSDIESAAKPHLAPMIQTRPRIVGTKAQEAIATWAFLKVLMFMQWPRPDASAASAEVYARFARERRPPAQARITLAGCHGEVSIGHYSHSGCDLTGPGGKRLDYEAHRAMLATLTVHRVLLQVFSHEMAEHLDYIPKPEYHEASEKIWPTRLPFTWPKSLMNHAAVLDFEVPAGRITPSGH